jgi:hypothetical protein
MDQAMTGVEEDEKNTKRTAPTGNRTQGKCFTAGGNRMSEYVSFIKGV